MRASTLLPLFLGACFSEDSYDDDVAATWCASLKSCDEDRFWRTYDAGTPECRETVAGEVRSVRYGQDEGRSGLAVRTTCTWKPEEASACLGDLYGVECALVLADASLPADCGRVAWDCITVQEPTP